MINPLDPNDPVLTGYQQSSQYPGLADMLSQRVHNNPNAIVSPNATVNPQVNPNAIVASNLDAGPQGNPNAIISPYANRSPVASIYRPSLPQPMESAPTLAQQMISMNSLMGADYSQQIGGAIGGFRDASNAYQNNIRALEANDAKLLDEAAKVKAKRDNELAGISGQRQQAATDAANTVASAQAVEEGVQSKASKDINDLYGELRQASQIDPDRFMKSKGAGATLVGALGMVLGGAGAGITGGPNQAAAVIERRINNDIRAQLEKRDGLKDLIAEKRAQIGDARAEMLGTANMVQLQSAQQLLGYAAKAEQVEQLAQGSLEGNAAGMLKNDLRRRAEDKFIQIQGNVAEVGVKGYAAMADAARSKQSLLMGALKSEERQILPNSVIATGPVSLDMAKAVRERISDYNEYMNYINRAEELRKKTGQSGKWLDDKDKREALEISKKLFNIDRKISGSGAALSPAEKEVIEMKNPTSLSIGLYDSVLGEIQARKYATNLGLQGFMQANNVALKRDLQEQQAAQGLRPH